MKDNDSKKPLCVEADKGDLPAAKKAFLLLYLVTRYWTQRSSF